MSQKPYDPIILQSPDGRYQLGVLPEIGASVSYFRYMPEQQENVMDLLRPYNPTDPYESLYMACFPLTPFCNRIIDGKMVFRGKEFDFESNRPDEPHYLHGDGWTRPWQVARQAFSEVVLILETEMTPGMPYAYAAELVYRLGNDGLQIDLAVTNKGNEAMPFGIGNHPFFPRNDMTTLQVNVPTMWQSDRIVPTYAAATPEKWNFSSGRNLSDDVLGPPVSGIAGKDIIDHVFQGWDQKAEITWPDRGVRLVFNAAPVFENFVIYVPDKKPFFCIEAVTNINDGFNLMAHGVPNTGTVILEPGQTMSGRTSMCSERL